MQLLNLGCGARVHHDWVNIDKVPTHPLVKQCDVASGIPFSDCHFDVVYHSHVLEHLEVNDAKQLMNECYRVLKPGGIIRVVVPDLEQIVLCYLQALKRLKTGDVTAHDDYAWIMLELYDQVVRNSSGGQMAVFLNKASFSNREFIVQRCGVEVENIMKRFEQAKRSKQFPDVKASKFVHLGSLLKPRNIFSNLREQALKFVLGNEYQALTIGRFRCSGENHQWMYDSVSLHAILSECGFVSIVQRGGDESYISGWTAYNLDTEPSGVTYKPDSLYMEAVKP